ncbi:MAG: pantoate--beta-alanine ligase [Gammaproteobacteria bacterium]|nr:pantoate--beta-alanine ligase [Gammaproteobacteria bacterium]
MHTEHHIKQVQHIVRDWQRKGLTVAFVPTMGNLHDGHLALVDKAGQLADKVVVSIFVNPIQFGPNEDFDSYPRTLEQDAVQLVDHGADLLFAPSVAEMYPQGRDNQTRITVPELSELYCGAFRPGFFTGVATVVNKLFNIVPADIAVFGEKDFQQLHIIRRMVFDLNLSMDIVGVPTRRESNGLAMSSRNGYLSETERETAAEIYRTLVVARQRILDGENDFADIEQAAINLLQQAGFKTDYFVICNALTLQAAQAGDTSLVILVAAHLGSTRLIDNISIEIQ